MDNENESLFGMNTVFPSAEALFSHSFQPVEKIKDDCFVVLDTNVLLFPYKTGKTTLEQISKIYKQLIEKNRLVVPGQAAREFAKNRGQKISDLFQQLSVKRSKANNLQSDDYPLLESLKEYKEILRLEDSINEQLSQYRKSIGQLLDQISLWQWNDPVTKLYNELFSKNVVRDIEPDRNKIRDDLSRRFQQKIPPGYKDAAKPDLGIGDLMIWYTILEVAEQHKKHLIFVSGEEKADWQIRSENQALYPRYELVDEYRQKSDGCSFHMLSFSKFLDLFDVIESVVAEIREKEMQTSSTDSNQLGFAALNQWLIGNYPDQLIQTSRTNADLEIVYADGSKIGVDVISTSPINASFLKHLFDTRSLLVQTKEFKNMIIAIISPNEIEERNIVALVEGNRVRSVPGVALLVGHILNSRFKPVYFSE